MKRKQLTRLAVHQTSKVCAIVYFVVAALIFIPLGFLDLFQDKKNVAMFFVVPLFYLIALYIGTAIICFIYNFVARTFGGIEYETAEINEQKLDQ